MNNLQNDPYSSLPEGFEPIDPASSLPKGFEMVDQSREQINNRLQAAESLPDGFVGEPQLGGAKPLNFDLGFEPSNVNVNSPENGVDDTATTQPDESKFNPDAVNEEEIGQGVVAGVARIPLGAYYLGEGLYNKLTGEDKHQAEVYIQNNKKFIEDNHLQGPALVGEMVGTSLLGGFVTKSALAVGLTGAGVETVAGKGAGRTNEEIAVGAGSAFILGAGGTALINKLTSNNPLSQAAEYMKALDTGKITEEEFSKLITNVPKDEQAIILAEGDVAYRKIFKNSINKDNKTAANLNKRLAIRKQVIDSYAASDEEMNKAIDDFGLMRKTIKEKVPDTFITDGIKDNIKAIEKIYESDPTPVGTTVRNIIADVGDEVDVDTALDLVENINATIRKPSISKNAKGNLRQVKNTLDTFIDIALKDKPNLLAIKNSAVNNYREVVNNYQLGALIKDNTKNDLAVNWAKLDKDIKKNKLNSTNLDYAKPIIKDFSKRFANDKNLGNDLPLSGAGTSNLLGLFGKFYGGIIDIGHKVLHTDRAHGLAIQKAVRKSINNPNNKYYNDYINDLKNNVDKNRRIPDDIKSQIDNYIDEIPKEPTREGLPYKGSEGNTGDVNLNPMYSNLDTNRVSEDVLGLNSEALIKNFVSSQQGVTNDIVEKATKLVDSSRYNRILNSSRAKLSVDDANKNKEMLKTIINTEVDTLVKRMEQDLGVKLPKQEANKIIMAKFKEMFNECK